MREFLLFTDKYLNYDTEENNRVNINTIMMNNCLKYLEYHHTINYLESTIKKHMVDQSAVQQKYINYNKNNK